MTNSVELGCFKVYCLCDKDNRSKEAVDTFVRKQSKFLDGREQLQNSMHYPDNEEAKVSGKKEKAQHLLKRYMRRDTPSIVYGRVKQMLEHADDS
jgi:hypothetical protein